MTTAMQANLGQEPEVCEFPLGSYDRKPQRHIDFSWVCGTNDAGAEVRVQLSCFHMTGRYVASLNNVVHEDSGVSITAPMSALRTTTVACPRYSKGAFEKFAWQALEELRGMADTELVRAYLRGDHAVDR